MGTNILAAPHVFFLTLSVWLHCVALDQSVLFPEQPVERCVGHLMLVTADPIRGAAYPEREELTRIIGLPHGSDSCRMACLLHRGCWAARFQTDHVGLETCILYPKMAVHVWWKPKPQRYLEDDEAIRPILLTIPTEWMNRTMPKQFHWTCCRGWWELLDLRAQEKTAKQIACALRESTDPTDSLSCTPGEPISLAGYIRHCPSRGYWSAYSHTYGVAIECQTIEEFVSLINNTLASERVQLFGSSATEVLIVSRFYTQNPLDCVTECYKHPCCVGPLYQLKRWWCILLGPIKGPSVCTTQISTSFEWGIPHKLSTLRVLLNPFILWRYECCSLPDWFSGRFAQTNDAFVRITEDRPFHPDQLGYCLCEAPQVDRIYLVNQSDLLCTEEKPCELEYRQKYAIAPSALLVDRHRPIAVHENGVTRWYGMKHQEWNKR
ncbi:unnamed protein product [Echinostoma caproni]|uniref:Apple domain-containing protein n=1 Tax=Echinostoma caproni TaxID=27848 RepID=A0A183AXH9_9TREM|nr:unnamed protein product [Echinostoma caproni]